MKRRTRSKDKPTLPVPIKPPVHKIEPALLRRRVRVLVVGCGGNGSEIVGGLPYLHQALLAWGHPGGIDVLLLDGDVVTSTNVVRQVFAPADVGHHKATVLVNRVNAFWGFDWQAIPQHLDAKSTQRLGADIVIGCVDSRGARKIIHDRILRDNGRVKYWLDLGNEAADGQFILGVPRKLKFDKEAFIAGDGMINTDRDHGVTRLPTVAELYPETIDPAGDKKDTLPSCSAQEALQRQEPFVNRALAAHALGMLTRLFRYGELAHHGGFVNLATGKLTPMPVSAEHWRRIIAMSARTKPAGSVQRRRTA